MEILDHALKVFFGFFAIMNPIANTAVFVSLSSELNDRQRVRAARNALLLTFAIVLLFSILGKAIFHFFGITLPALRIAGGILVFIIGYHMLHGESSSLHKAGNHDLDDFVVSPLAVPILAGPGTLATAMSFSASASAIDLLFTVGIFALLCIVTYLSFLFGHRMVRWLGEAGLKIVTRLMGLILAIIGVQMLIAGVYGAVSNFSVA